MALVGKAYKATFQVIGTIAVVAVVAVALISGEVSRDGFLSFVGLILAVAAGVAVGGRIFR